MELLSDYVVLVKGDGGNNKWKEASGAFNEGVNKNIHWWRGGSCMQQLPVVLLR